MIELYGNPVKFGDGPAAVIGDKSRKLPLLWRSSKWEGAVIRIIRKSEDLPELLCAYFVDKWALLPEDKKGTSPDLIFFRFGFFFIKSAWPEHEIYSCPQQISRSLGGLFLFDFYHRGL